MITRGELRTILRRDKLKDDTATRYRWADETINEAIEEAVLDYSQHFPRERRTTIAHVDSQHDYTLPTDFKEVRYLIDSDGVRYAALTPGDYEERIHLDEDADGGYAYPTFGIPYEDGSTAFYSVWGGQIYLTPTPDQDLILYYAARHEFPTADASAMTVPDEDKDLLILYAWAVCLTRDSSADALLQRWDETSGRRDDNPVILQSTRLFNAYHDKIRERKALREGGAT